MTKIEHFEHTNNFIFEDIDESTNGSTLKLGDFSYWFDMNSGEILFKTKYKCQQFTHYCKEFAIFVENYVYITNRYGNKLFKIKLEKYNSFMENKEKEFKILFNKNKPKNENNKYKIGKYDYVKKFINDTKEYFIVRTNELYALIDDKNNALIDFKYSFLHENYFEKMNKLLFVAQNPQTKLFGIIDINENVIIPFIYDDIYIFGIYIVIVKKLV